MRKSQEVPRMTERPTRGDSVVVENGRITMINGEPVAQPAPAEMPAEPMPEEESHA